METRPALWRLDRWTIGPSLRNLESGPEGFLNRKPQTFRTKEGHCTHSEDSCPGSLRTSASACKRPSHEANPSAPSISSTAPSSRAVMPSDWARAPKVMRSRCVNWKRSSASVSNLITSASRCAAGSFGQPEVRLRHPRCRSASGHPRRWQSTRNPWPAPVRCFASDGAQGLQSVCWSSRLIRRFHRSPSAGATGLGRRGVFHSARRG